MIVKTFFIFAGYDDCFSYILSRFEELAEMYIIKSMDFDELNLIREKAQEIGSQKILKMTLQKIYDPILAPNRSF